jgi:uncharacterized protein YndB with AHSA1/START domain
MTVTDIKKDREALTMTVTCSFAATPEQVWSLWADPRLLERWWGPPTYPATFEEHELVPGARSSYYMTGPDGERPRGWWKVLSVDPPNGLELEDGFADAEGNPTDDPVGLMRITIRPAGDGRTEMLVASTFPSAEAMEQLLAMGQEEGMREAMGQIDALLAEVQAG